MTNFYYDVKIRAGIDPTVYSALNRLESRINKIGGKQGLAGVASLNRSLDQTSTSSKNATRSLGNVTNSVRRSGIEATRAKLAFAGLGSIGLLGLFRIVQGLTRAFTTLVDRFTKLRNQLTIATKTQIELNVAMEGMLKIARTTGAEIDTLGVVYNRLFIALGDFGISQKEILRFTESLAKSYAVAGLSAQEASGSTRQFLQGLAANRLSGQELNSVLEQNILLTRELAKALGVPVSGVRKLANSGAVTTEVALRALRSLESVDALFKQTTRTFGQLISIVSVDLGGFFSEVITQLTGLKGVEEVFRDLGKEIKKMTQYVKENEDFFKDLRAVMSLAGKAANLLSGSWKELLAVLIAFAFRNTIVGRVYGLYTVINRLVKVTGLFTKETKDASRAQINLGKATSENAKFQQRYAKYVEKAGPRKKFNKELADKQKEAKALNDIAEGQRHFSEESQRSVQPLKQQAQATEDLALNAEKLKDTQGELNRLFKDRDNIERSLTNTGKRTDRITKDYKEQVDSVSKSLKYQKEKLKNLRDQSKASSYITKLERLRAKILEGTSKTKPLAAYRQRTIDRIDRLLKIERSRIPVLDKRTKQEKFLNELLEDRSKIRSDPKGYGKVLSRDLSSEQKTQVDQLEKLSKVTTDRLKDLNDEVTVTKRITNLEKQRAALADKLKDAGVRADGRREVSGRLSQRLKEVKKGYDDASKGSANLTENEKLLLQLQKERDSLVKDLQKAQEGNYSVVSKEQLKEHKRLGNLIERIKEVTNGIDEQFAAELKLYVLRQKREGILDRPSFSLRKYGGSSRDGIYSPEQQKQLKTLDDLIDKQKRLADSFRKEGDAPTRRSYVEDLKDEVDSLEFAAQQSKGLTKSEKKRFDDLRARVKLFDDVEKNLRFQFRLNRALENMDNKRFVSLSEIKDLMNDMAKLEKQLGIESLKNVKNPEQVLELLKERFRLLSNPKLRKVEERVSGGIQLPGFRSKSVRELTERQRKEISYIDELIKKYDKLGKIKNNTDKLTARFREVDLKANRELRADVAFQEARGRAKTLEDIANSEKRINELTERRAQILRSPEGTDEAARRRAIAPIEEEIRQTNNLIGAQRKLVENIKEVVRYEKVLSNVRKAKARIEEGPKGKATSREKILTVFQEKEIKNINKLIQLGKRNQATLADQAKYMNRIAYLQKRLAGLRKEEKDAIRLSKQLTENKKKEIRYIEKLIKSNEKALRVLQKTEKTTAKQIQQKKAELETSIDPKTLAAAAENVGAIGNAQGGFSQQIKETIASIGILGTAMGGIYWFLGWLGDVWKEAIKTEREIQETAEAIERLNKAAEAERALKYEDSIRSMINANDDFKNSLLDIDDILALTDEEFGRFINELSFKDLDVALLDQFDNTYSKKIIEDLKNIKKAEVDFGVTLLDQEQRHVTLATRILSLYVARSQAAARLAAENDKIIEKAEKSAGPTIEGADQFVRRLRLEDFEGVDRYLNQTNDAIAKLIRSLNRAEQKARELGKANINTGQLLGKETATTLTRLAGVFPVLQEIYKKITEGQIENEELRAQVAKEGLALVEKELNIANALLNAGVESDTLSQAADALAEFVFHFRELIDLTADRVKLEKLGDSLGKVRENIDNLGANRGSAFNIEEKISGYESELNNIRSIRQGVTVLELTDPRDIQRLQQMLQLLDSLERKLNFRIARGNFQKLLKDIEEQGTASLRQNNLALESVKQTYGLSKKTGLKGLFSLDEARSGQKAIIARFRKFRQELTEEVAKYPNIAKKMEKEIKAIFQDLDTGIAQSTQSVRELDFQELLDRREFITSDPFQFNRSTEEQLSAVNSIISGIKAKQEELKDFNYAEGLLADLERLADFLEFRIFEKRQIIIDIDQALADTKRLADQISRGIGGAIGTAIERSETFGKIWSRTASVAAKQTSNLIAAAVKYSAEIDAIEEKQKQVVTEIILPSLLLQRKLPRQMRRRVQNRRQ